MAEQKVLKKLGAILILTFIVGGCLGPKSLQPTDEWQTLYNRVDRFWKLILAGQTGEAYEFCSEEYKEHTPIEMFSNVYVQNAFSQNKGYRIGPIRFTDDKQQAMVTCYIDYYLFVSEIVQLTQDYVDEELWVKEDGVWKLGYIPQPPVMGVCGH